MARAAATSMSVVMSEAPASSRPRKRPGKARTLLIWFGKSERPVATTAACRAATAGSTSGSGFAMAKTMPWSAMAAMSSSSRRSGAETPTNTSAPTMASLREPEKPASLVFSAIHCRWASW